MILVLHDNKSEILNEIRKAKNTDEIHQIATKQGLIASHTFNMNWIALAETPTGEDIFIARQMDSITYKGKEYPVRTFTTEFEGDVSTHMIATESLSTAIGIDENYDGNLDEEEEEIDQSIYYYVEDGVIEMDAEVICKDHLDVEMKFISEE